MVTCENCKNWRCASENKEFGFCENYKTMNSFRFRIHCPVAPLDAQIDICTRSDFACSLGLKKEIL